MGRGQMEPYEVEVKMGSIRGPSLIAPGVGSPNHRRYDQGSVAVICTTTAVKSHFDARSRHTFETNEHCLSEKISSRSWSMISFVRFGATRIATVAVKDDLRTIIRERGSVALGWWSQTVGFLCSCLPTRLASQGVDW